MDGETTRVIITGVFGFVGTVAVAFISSRPNIITATIALRQLEEKERSKEEAGDYSEEIASIRDELESLKKTKVESERGRRYRWIRKQVQRDRARNKRKR